MINFINPTDELIEIMAQDMRKSDRIEVMASHGHEPLEALKYSRDNSDYVTMVMSGNIPMCMFGVSISNVTTGLGHPWLLSSNEIFSNKEYFLKNAPGVIEDMIAVCPRLVNYVRHENKVSIEWLKSLGFTIENPEPHGVKNDLFHKFHMGVV